jgi:hypothetical protein
MRTANKSFLGFLFGFAEGQYKYAATDKKYMIIAVTTTMSKFGPSGSLKSENKSLEQTRDVIPKISNGVFFDLKCIWVIIV